tara:strand:+ start:45 stop:497 length:453 start_codon:yes stop_codon:yes gene_type:complete
VLIVNRHGVFLATNSINFDNEASNELDDPNHILVELPEFCIELRSPSVSDLMGLIENFPDECGEWDVQEIPLVEMPAFRFKIDIEPERWVTLLAKLGAGITYKSFNDELRELSKYGMVDSGVVTLVSNLRVLMMQIYSRMFGSFESRTIN